MRAVTVEDAGTVAARYKRLIDDMGVRRAQRRLGIRINAARQPTVRELRDAVRRLGMSIVRLEFNDVVPPFDAKAPAADTDDEVEQRPRTASGEEGRTRRGPP